MGNCCGRESGNFSGEGRTLGSTPASAPPPTDRASAKIPSAGQRLGGGSQPAGGQSDARTKAAQAAEERYQNNNAPPGGKLQEQLNKNKSKSTNQHLADSANENLAHRQMDAAVITQRND